jgi:transcriptional regulator with XRE-family HTH domain
MEDKELATAITKFREGIGMSQSKLARVVGVSPGAINQYERGKQGLRSATLAKVVDSLLVEAKGKAIPSSLVKYQTRLTAFAFGQLMPFIKREIELLRETGEKPTFYDVFVRGSLAQYAPQPPNSMIEALGSEGQRRYEDLRIAHLKVEIERTERQLELLRELLSEAKAKR